MISVIMGVYNGSETIGAAINSLKSESPFEIICVDDASTDNTLEILYALAREIPFLTVLKNDENRGLAYCLNKAFLVSKGSFIARMDADDISYPDRLNIEYNFLQSNPSYAYVSGAVRLFDEDGCYGLRSYPDNPSAKDYAKGNPFVHPALMFRRECLEKTGGYNESDNCRRCEDYELMFRLYALGYYGYNLHEILLDFYESRRTVKHTFKSRMNEYRIRKSGYKLAGIPRRLRIYKYKPVIYALMPKKIYKRLFLKNVDKTGEDEFRKI